MSFFSHFLILFLLTFGVLSGFAFLFNYCRRRLQASRHGLTGMCHKQGGPTCGQCQTNRQGKNSVI